MTGTRSNTKSRRAVVVRAAVGLLLVGATPAVGQAFGLDGVWLVVTQERNCATDAPIGPPTRALVTYHRGGTVTEDRYIPVFAPGQLSDGQGEWRYAGWRTFTGRVVTMVQFDTPPNTPPGLPVFQAGWQIATQTITLNSYNEFSMTGTSEFLNLNGEVYRTGCASRVGQRFR